MSINISLYIIPILLTSLFFFIKSPKEHRVLFLFHPIFSLVTLFILFNNYDLTYLIFVLGILVMIKSPKQNYLYIILFFIATLINIRSPEYFQKTATFTKTTFIYYCLCLSFSGLFVSEAIIHAFTRIEDFLNNLFKKNWTFSIKHLISKRVFFQYLLIFILLPYMKIYLLILILQHKLNSNLVFLSQKIARNIYSSYLNLFFINFLHLNPSLKLKFTLSISSSIINSLIVQ